ncbi:hypothetical protein K0A96_00005 [Patescibacteria group bacterium]|nr:hypothetical protein [Patescibacteria group bacterium]
MTNKQIINQLLNDYFLSDQELKQAEQVVFTLQQRLKKRTSGNKRFKPNEKLENEILQIVEDSHFLTQSDLQGIVAVIASKYVERETK